MKPTLNMVREMFSYDENNGHLRWRKSTNRALKAGSRAGHLTKRGYRRVCINDRMYAVHRIIWFYVHGDWPVKLIDHINGEPDDNRIENLREATNAENCRNRGAQRNNKSGFKGVGWHKRDRKWQAYIAVDGRQRSLGNYDTPEAAAKAYERAAEMLHGEFARL